MTKFVVGVMGPGGGARDEDLSNARELGKLIGEEGWVVLSGGRNAGVMDAVSRGAKDAGGLVVGVLPTADRSGCSDAVDIAIVTDMGNARNNINVLSSDVVVACGMGPGTASEVALALKSQKPVVLLNTGADSEKFFGDLCPDRVLTASTPEQAIEIIKQIARE